MSLWWRHYIYLWRHNGACHHARAKHYEYFMLAEYFQNFDVYFINRYLTVWGFTIVFPQVPSFKKLSDFSIHLLIPTCGQFVTINTSQDEFSFGKTLVLPETTYFTHKEDFSWQGTIPKWAPFAPNGTANQIAGKSWNHRGQYWTLNPMARKPWISHPSVG